MCEVYRSIEHLFVERKQFEPRLGAQRLKHVVQLPEFSADLLFKAVQHFSRGTFLVRGYCLFRPCSSEVLPNRIRFVSRLAFLHDGRPCLGQTRGGKMEAHCICPCTFQEFDGVQAFVMCWGRISKHPVCFHKDVAHRFASPRAASADRRLARCHRPRRAGRWIR